MLGLKGHSSLQSNPYEIRRDMMGVIVEITDEGDRRIGRTFRLGEAVVSRTGVNGTINEIIPPDDPGSVRPVRLNEQDWFPLDEIE